MKRIFTVPSYLYHTKNLVIVDNPREDKEFKALCEDGIIKEDSAPVHYPVCYASFDATSLFKGNEKSAFIIGKENYSMIGLDAFKAIVGVIKGEKIA